MSHYFLLYLIYEKMSNYFVSGLINLLIISVFDINYNESSKNFYLRINRRNNNVKQILSMMFW